MLLKIISVFLFVLGISEIVGLGYYISSMSQSTSTACCGIISYDDFADGAACNSSDITGNAIEHTTVDGNVWCTVNGVRCEARTLETGFTTTLSQCFEESGHNISSLCSAEALETAAQHAETVPVVLAGIVLVFLAWSTLSVILGLFGCCDKCNETSESVRSSECCRSKECSGRLMLFNVTFGLLMWVTLFVICRVFMDSILEDGYALDSVDSITGLLYGTEVSSLDDIADDVDAACDLDGFSWDEGFIWLNYEMNINSYLTSELYQWVNAVGLLLGTVELLLSIKLHCLNHSLWTHDNAVRHVQETSGATV
jgi:hypothetical protein